jgi:DUF971 family protein
MDPVPKIRSTNAVGHYALGVDWVDGHDSILPLSSLRAHCPCDGCTAERDSGQPPAGSAQLVALERLGEESVFLRWVDGHETIYLVAELRALCRCAYCAGEPERPITG